MRWWNCHLTWTIHTRGKQHCCSDSQNRISCFWGICQDYVSDCRLVYCWYEFCVNKHLLLLQTFSRVWKNCLQMKQNGCHVKHIHIVRRQGAGGIRTFHRLLEEHYCLTSVFNLTNNFITKIYIYLQFRHFVRDYESLSKMRIYQKNVCVISNKMN